jgi:hypothetical protein
MRLSAVKFSTAISVNNEISFCNIPTDYSSVMLSIRSDNYMITALVITILLDRMQDKSCIEIKKYTKLCNEDRHGET